jgi:hypothetical protein
MMDGILVQVRNGSCGAELAHEDSADCWCRPDAAQTCPQCDGDLIDVGDCHRCRGRGVVPALDLSAPMIFVHR